MEDKNNEENLPQQDFGAPVAGVEGVTVPGAPTSLSSEGPTGVLPTGTLAELATVEERRVLGRPNVPEENLWVERAERMEEGLRREINVNLEKAMEGMDPPKVEVDSRDADWEPLLESLAGNFHGATEDMEVTEEALTKKRKAATSPIIISDDEDNADIAPCGSRKCRAIEDSSEENVTDYVKGKEKKTSTLPAGVTTGEEGAEVLTSTRSGTLRSGKKRNLKSMPTDPGTDHTGRSESEEEWTETESRVSTAGSVKSRAGPRSSKKKNSDWRSRLRVVLSRDQFEDISASGLGSMGIEWIEDINTIRLNCGSLQGTLSGLIKERIKASTEVIRTLTGGVDSSENSSYLTVRNVELKRQLEAAKLECSKLAKKVGILEKEKEESKRRETETRSKATGKGSEKKDGKGITNSEKTRPKPVPARPDPDDVRAEPIKGPSTSRIDRQAAELDFFDSLTPVNKREMAVEDVNRWIKTMSLWRKEIREKERDSKGKATEISEGKQLGPGTTRSEFVEPLPQRPPKGTPRVVSNLQLVPPRTPRQATPRIKENMAAGGTERNTQALIKTDWKEVVTKRRGSDKTKGKGEASDGNSRKKYPRESTKGTGKGKERNSGRKPPKSAAVAISGTGEEFSYADVLRKAREKIDLKALKIDNSRIRPSANGGILIEIPGKEGNSKADALIEKLRETFDSEIASKKVHFSRPMLKGDIRVTGIDVSIWEEDIRDSILDYGECAADNIRVSKIQRMRNGIGVAWVQCPLATAIKICASGGLRVGWTTARVELLKARPVQCFRCWKFGHVRGMCSDPNDRSHACYRCGKEGHSARICDAVPCCVLCIEQGRDGNHRMGSDLCGAERGQSRPTKAWSAGRTRDPARGAEAPMETEDES